MSYGGTMLWDGEHGRTAARTRARNEIEALQVGPAAMVRFVAPGALTDGQFGLFQWDMAPRAGGANPHFHRTLSESFFVLDGSVELYDGAVWQAATTGDFLYVAPAASMGSATEPTTRRRCSYSSCRVRHASATSRSSLRSSARDGSSPRTNGSSCGPGMISIRAGRSTERQPSTLPRGTQQPATKPSASRSKRSRRENSDGVSKTWFRLPAVA